MNLGDPELELIDPTPNVHTLFIHFDSVFFSAKLASRAVVRWSKRMYSCAGICSYEGQGGLCDIALSEPLLKLRPRKDLIETLLHEMIHAYLFITCRDRERDGHGPNFQAHMHRINKSAGINITIYHDFHDEVKLYQTHWWRCDGPCQKMRPYFGIVRRPQNRKPGPSDSWWNAHQRTCGGTFVKIKEPEPKPNKVAKQKSNNNGDIKKYVNNNNTKLTNKNVTPAVRKPLTPIAKNVSGTPPAKAKSNSVNNTATKSNNTIQNFFTPFTGKGETLISSSDKSSSSVTNMVRNIWANKQVPGMNSKPITQTRKSLPTSSTDFSQVTKPNKHKADPIHSGSPPTKVKKIDDYFKKTATSLLKDIYGKDIKLTLADNKIVAIDNKKIKCVDCPICNQKIDENEINRHLDECLNKDVVEKLSKDSVILVPEVPESQNTISNIKNEVVLKQNNTNKLLIKEEKIFKNDGQVNPNISNIIDLTHINYVNLPPNPKIKPEVKTENFEDLDNNFDVNDVNKVKAIVKRITYDKHIRKSDNFIVPKEEPKEVDCGFLPSFLDDMGTAIKAPVVKVEPGTSKDVVSFTVQKCPCCGNSVDKPMAEHLDECQSFYDNNTTIRGEGASTSFADNTIVIDDDEDDIFDETQTFNATGTKTPCPCCLNMIEIAEMNAHLDTCLC